jgi:PIN domain nuclease of toxin-antitoxin system
VKVLLDTNVLVRLMAADHLPRKWNGCSKKREPTWLPIRFRHLDELSALPEHDDHRDPFHRMLIAQALAEDLSMVSSDTRFEEYKRHRVIWK